MDEAKRAELLREFRAAAEDTVNEWLRRWQADDGANLRARYMDDGTVELEREDDVSIESFRLRFGVAVVEVPDAQIESVELDRPWREVFEGNEVLAPNGEWYRITSIPPWHEDDGSIRIGMDIKGKEGFFPRDPDAKVRVRVNMPDPMESALAALRAGFGEVDVIGR